MPRATRHLSVSFEAGGCGRIAEKAFVLVGVPSHSGRFRAHLTERMDQAHLGGSIHQVLVRLGGSARRWRVDRMATILVPGSNRIQPSFAGVAKHYSVAVDPCPPRRPNRKGVVEKAIDYVTRCSTKTTLAGQSNRRSSPSRNLDQAKGINETKS